MPLRDAAKEHSAAPRGAAERPEVQRIRPRRGNAALPALALLLAAVMTAYLGLRLRAISVSNATAEARDAVTLRAAETVSRLLSEGDYDSGWFITLERDSAGGVAAVTTNTARVNRFAAEFISALTREAENGQLDIRMPLGDLLGAGLLLGRGPEVSVRIGVRSTSVVRFANEFTAVGINQSRYSLKLTADVDIDMLVPWGSAQTAVRAEVPIAETVIVGSVPETYVALPAPGEQSE